MWGCQVAWAVESLSEMGAGDANAPDYATQAFRAKREVSGCDHWSAGPLVFIGQTVYFSGGDGREVMAESWGCSKAGKRCANVVQTYVHTQHVKMEGCLEAGRRRVTLVSNTTPHSEVMMAPEGLESG